MKYHYTNSPMVCSESIDLDVENGIVGDVVFHGGCPGNLLAIPKLVRGRRAEEVISLLKGNPCGGKPTSCADQLACALEKILAEKKN